MSQAENPYLLNSSMDGALQALARRLPSKRAEAFLRELLNVRSEDVASAQRLTTRFSEFIPFALDAGHEKAASNFARLWQWRVFLEEAWKQPTTVAREIAMLRPLHMLLEDFYKVRVAELVKKAQRSPRRFTAEEESQWTAVRAADPDRGHAKKYAASVNYVAAPGKGLPLEFARAAYGNLVVAIVHALRIADRMRCCGNSACQVVPYFIARRRSQKYCSDVCARPSQREFKAAWWREHGEKWRAKRMKKKKARRKGGKT